MAFVLRSAQSVGRRTRSDCGEERKGYIIVDFTSYQRKMQQKFEQIVQTLVPRRFSGKSSVE